MWMKIRKNVMLEEDMLIKVDDIARNFKGDRSEAINHCIRSYLSLGGEADRLTVTYVKSNMDIILGSGQWKDAQHFINSVVVTTAGQIANEVVKEGKPLEGSNVVNTKSGVENWIKNLNNKKPSQGYTDNDGIWHEPNES